MSTLPERQTDLILKIDQLRDRVADERELALSISGALAEAFAADLCLLSLPDEDTGRLELRALVDKSQTFGARSEGMWHHLVERAANSPAQSFLDTSHDLGKGEWMSYLGAPLRAGDQPLGAILLARARKFTPDDHALLAAAVSQTDSAILHIQTLRDLRRRTLELETLLAVDRIRDSRLEFQQMLDATLAELARVVACGAAFIMLFDKSGRQLELRAVTDRDLFDLPESQAAVRAAADEALRRAEPISRTVPSGPVRSLIGAPLILNEKIIGVLGVVNRQGREAFTRADRDLLRDIASQIDTAIFESLETQRIRAVFGRSVGPQVMKRLLEASDDRDLLEGDRAEITTLFSDIRGFTEISERLDVGLLEDMLNEHLGAMSELVLAHDGTLDKYVGDCVMAFFNAPERQPDHAWRAVLLALDMQAAHQEIMRRWKARGLPAPPIGIGVSTGAAIVGNFGSVKRLEYSVIGADVNLASRLCGAAEGNQTLISQSAFDLLRDRIVAEPTPPLRLKGIEEPVRAWEVRGLR